VIQDENIILKIVFQIHRHRHRYSLFVWWVYL